MLGSFGLVEHWSFLASQQRFAMNIAIEAGNECRNQRWLLQCDPGPPSFQLRDAQRPWMDFTMRSFNVGDVSHGEHKGRKLQACVFSRGVNCIQFEFHSGKLPVARLAIVQRVHVFLDFAKFKVLKTSLSVGFWIVGDATATSHTSVDGWIISMNTSHSWLPTFMPQLFGVLTGQKCWETDTAGCPLLCGCFLCKPKPCKKAPEDLLDVLPNRRRKGNGMQWDLLAFSAAFDLLFSRSPVYEHLLSGGLAVVSLDLPRNCAVDLSR